jgi:hypothetical protein
LAQHGLALALLDVLPCRIVGDPLQGIFDFGDNEAIQWDEHVSSAFDPVAGPTKPWRWVDTNPALGVMPFGNSLGKIYLVLLWALSTYAGNAKTFSANTKISS